MEIRPVAHFRSPLKTKFGIPKQSGLAHSLKGSIVFEPEWRTPDAIRGIDGFSYLWLIWGFSANKHEAAGTTVRPPVLGGNTRMGIWATRSPFRPNNLGLSSVKVEHIDWSDNDGPVIHVSGADLMDGTPIYDIKPYLAYVDSHPDARSGFAEEKAEYELKVIFPEELLTKVPVEKQKALVEVLKQDPRPAYQEDENRIYGVAFAGMNVRFYVREGVLTVVEVEKI